VTIGLLNAASAQGQSDTGKTLPNILLSADASGFFPFDGIYRINYGTSLAGLPIELAGGVGFPINSNLAGMVGIRYKRRTANFVPNFRIKTLEIELGVHDYLEKERMNDLRLFGSAGLLLETSTATGNIDNTADGKNIVQSEVSKDYYNIGLGLDLGVDYPLTKISGLYIVLHLGIYFADPVAAGGLGNIGGVSIGLGYRINL
jgi:hypothetical protein